MDHGIKISKVGYDVLNQKKTKKLITNKDPILKPNTHLLYVISLAYLLGAKKQIERYKTIASQLQNNTVNSVYSCLHEASALFEDLATISIYAEQCGDQHEDHALWKTIRNHIRHDIRENFDNETKERKIERANKLEIPSTLQTNIGFDPSSIKVGGIVVELIRIEQYLSWAETKIDKTLELAKNKGYLDNKPFVRNDSR